MSKGAVIAAVVVGGVVIIGGAALAMASTKPNPYPNNLAPPPPPPPENSLGRYLVREGGAVLDELGKNDYVHAYTGGTANYAKEFAINPYYATGKAAVRLWHKIF